MAHLDVRPAADAAQDELASRRGECCFCFVPTPGTCGDEPGRPKAAKTRIATTHDPGEHEEDGATLDGPLARRGSGAARAAGAARRASS